MPFDRTLWLAGVCKADCSSEIQVFAAGATGVAVVGLSLTVATGQPLANHQELVWTQLDFYVLPTLQKPFASHLGP